MDFKQRRLGKYIVFDLSGEFSKLDHSPAFEEELEQTVKAGNLFLGFNLANVSYMDSSGINTLIRIRKKIGPAGNMVALEPAPEVRDLFNLLGMNILLEIFADEKDFVRAL